MEGTDGLSGQGRRMEGELREDRSWGCGHGHWDEPNSSSRCLVRGQGLTRPGLPRTSRWEETGPGPWATEGSQPRGDGSRRWRDGVPGRGQETTRGNQGRTRQRAAAKQHRCQGTRGQPRGWGLQTQERGDTLSPKSPSPSPLPYSQPSRPPAQAGCRFHDNPASQKVRRVGGACRGNCSHWQGGRGARGRAGPAGCSGRGPEPQFLAPTPPRMLTPP